MFPTESRMRQKEKHKQHTELTGEKHVPTPKPEKIEFGDDDCGTGSTACRWLSDRRSGPRDPWVVKGAINSFDGRLGRVKSEISAAQLGSCSGL